MEPLTRNPEVRLTVARCFRTLKSSTDSSEVITALQMLRSYLDEGPQGAATSAERTEFRRAHYTSALQLLVSNIQADWSHQLTAAQRAELWDDFFLRGPPEQALLVLMDAIGQLRWVLLDGGRDTFIIIIIISFPNHLPVSRPCRRTSDLDHMVSITEKFLQRGRLAELLGSYCLEAAPCDSPQLRETLLGRISALPDITANRLHPHNRAAFLPQQYYPLLAAEMLSALERTCRALRGQGASLKTDAYRGILL